MGGRGASSGVSEKGKPYGSEYRTLYKNGNIKFVEAKAKSAAAPLETMTKRRVYVTVNPKYGPAYISYYDSMNKRTKTIDLQHMHGRQKPHVHHGYIHNEKDGPKGATGLSDKEKRMVARIKKIWYNRHSKQ